MPVRKTESRQPASTTASDLGQGVVAADGRSALVSLVTSPLVLGRATTTSGSSPTRPSPPRPSVDRAQS